MTATERERHKRLLKTARKIAREASIKGAELIKEHERYCTQLRRQLKGEPS